MCGIVGYVGHRDAAGFLMPALRRLEYRGYDSAGLATVNGHGDEVVSVGFSADGKFLATTSLDKTIKIWDVSAAPRA